MGRLAYGKVSREKVCQLLEALLDFSHDHLEPNFSEQLRKKGLRCHRADWHTDSPKLDIYGTRPLLIELVQFRYQSHALIDTKPKLKESLDHLEQTLSCLRLRQKKQGRQIVDGTFSLWSTDTETNIAAIRALWPQSKRRSQQPESVDGGDGIDSSQSVTAADFRDEQYRVSGSPQTASQIGRAHV